MKRTPYHVYESDGFVSAHRSKAAAVAAAKKASSKRGDVRVFRADAFGYTGPRRGSCVARFVRGVSRECGQ